MGELIKVLICQSIHISVLVENQFISHIYTLYEKVPFDHS